MFFHKPLIPKVEPTLTSLRSTSGSSTDRYKDTWPAGIVCIEGGLVDVRKLVSHVFPLEQALEGLTLSSDPRNGCIEVQIVDETETSNF